RAPHGRRVAGAVLGACWALRSIGEPITAIAQSSRLSAPVQDLLRRPARVVESYVQSLGRSGLRPHSNCGCKQTNPHDPSYNGLVFHCFLTAEKQGSPLAITAFHRVRT